VAAAYPETSSVYADEGTAAHEFASRCLTAGDDAADHLGEEVVVPSRTGGQGREFVLDQTMADHVQGYLDRTRRWLDFAGGDLYVEQPLLIEHVTGEKGARGTSDAVIVLTSPATGRVDLVVRDLKYGQGVPVDAVENLQLLIYAAGAVAQFSLAYEITDASLVRMQIDQPRRKHQSTWTVTVADLNARIDHVKAAARVALSTPADGTRVAGEHCRFCPARAVCPTRAAYIAQSMGVDTGPEGFTAPTIQTLSDPEIVARHLARVGEIRAWCTSIEQEAHAMLVRGEKLPGFKLVQGNPGNRAWTNHERAVFALRQFGLDDVQIYESRLISPAAAEKIVPKDSRAALAALIRRPPGAPSVAPDSDPRPPLTSASTDADGFTASSDADNPEVL